MSMADIEAAALQRASDVLILDIERMKGRAEIEFWDLGDFKNRRIHADDVTLWPRTICAAWNWYDERRVHFAAEWSTGREDMLRELWDAYDRAQVVVGHNLAAFDSKKLKSEWRDLGLPPPSPSKPIDTLSAARSRFGDESKTLDALCHRIGLTGKSDRYDIEVARAACAGDKDAQDRIRNYNAGDIDATEALYVTLLPWIKSHPHVAPNAGTDKPL